MQVPFQKMHGTGNVILIVDQRDSDRVPPTREKLRQLGDVEKGPGFDQLMWLTSASNAEYDASYRVFNADGSEVEQCGNGVRCVARYLAANDELPHTFSFESPAGPIAATVGVDGQVSVSMGAPIFAPARIPFDVPQETLGYGLLIREGEIDVSVLSMGNPHCVIRVDDVNSAAVGEIGSEIEHHPRFPQRCNVGFMQIEAPDRIALRVHERGVGETKACGTGACAAVVAGIRRGWLNEEVTVSLPGGEVMISWRRAGSPVWLSGNAETVGHGMMQL